MKSGTRPSGRYEGDEGRRFAERYESVDPDHLHSWISGRLPQGPAAVLDVGAGSGRDADWFAAKDLDVVAVDPSATMRDEAKRRHPSPRITWLCDLLPALDRVSKQGTGFELIWLNAVWMHVPPDARARAFRKLVGMLKPGGLIVFALRIGGADLEDGMHSTDIDEIEYLARRHGASAEERRRTCDALERPGVHWEQIALRLPDDGTGALPLLRHVILNDKKSATYKLGLLRSVARAADGAAGMAHYGDVTVSVPLGLVALNWIRLYKPLVDAGPPQQPGANATRLGFVKAGWDGRRDTPAFDLKAGRSFRGDAARVLHQAIRDAVNTLVSMPIQHMTFPGSDRPILKVDKQRAGRPPNVILIDRDYLARFGELRVPLHLWRSLARHDTWIEPALVGEWTALMERWAQKQNRTLDRLAVENAMRWSDPTRDVEFARKISRQLLDEGRLHCVWTGARLTGGQLDIDHCMPWAAWPCDDLWNLMPADRHINQNQKRALLPSAEALEEARDRICTWWETGYVARVPDRFFAEARASLPVSEPDFDDLFDGLQARRRTLRSDHRIDEWTPIRDGAL